MVRMNDRSTAPVVNATEYLQLVIERIACHGHRDVDFFNQAASRATVALNNNNNNNAAHRLCYAKEVRDLIVEGLKIFVPGYRYFDVTVGVDYAFLVAKYNSLLPADIFGHTEKQAKAIFGEPHFHSRISLVDGIWVARFANRPDAYAQRRGATKLQVGYAAINSNGDVVANGTRKDTIALAKTVHARRS
jgi:hypothetical protein